MAICRDIWDIVMRHDTRVKRAEVRGPTKQESQSNYMSQRGISARHYVTEPKLPDFTVDKA